MVEVSDDGTNWSEAYRGELLSTFDPQTIRFGKTITTRFIRIRSLSGFGSDKMTAIAEVAGFVDILPDSFSKIRQRALQRIYVRRTVGDLVRILAQT